MFFLAILYMCFAVIFNMAYGNSIPELALLVFKNNNFGTSLIKIIYAVSIAFTYVIYILASFSIIEN